MRLSNCFYITRREFPKDEETLSAKLLIKSGMIYKNDKGIYTYLPFGLKVVENVKKIIKEEFEKINANEVIMPTLVPSKVFDDTERKELFGKEMFNLVDRNKKHYSLCPTSEELFAVLARNKIMSYKDLHFTLFQIGNKYRDEVDLKCGLSRKKEFIMADAYSFDANDGGADISYDKMYLSFKNIFTKMGLNTMVVRSDAAYMKGLSSEEFQVISEQGDNLVVKCNNCTFASNIEDADCKNTYKLYSDKLERKELINTHGITKIPDLSKALGIPVNTFIKSLIFKVNGVYKMILLRGNSEVNINKLRRLFKTNDIEVPSSQELERMGTLEGFVGPMDCTMDVIADNEIKSLINAVVGSNKKNKHWLNICPGKDFKVTKYADVKLFDENSVCPKCKGKCKILKGIEVGHIFKLGDNYSKYYELKYVDEKNESNYVHMGSYGIGVDRCINSIVESYHDDMGIMWPMNIAPFKVGIIIANVNDRDTFKYAKNLYEKFNSMGIDCLLDDRKETVGVKFNDLDLIGVPIRITVGQNYSSGEVELKLRNSFMTEFIDTKDIVNKVKKIVENY